jgi:L-alanine-DL-glutamate epimerase-like enolase superfamily enzyme
VNAHTERLSMALETPFGIARGTTRTAENVLVELAADGETGLGAAAPSRHYGETAATVEAVLPDLLAAVEDRDPLATRAVERALAETVRGNPAARAGVSIAVHDLAARRLDVPLYRLFGLDPATATVPRSSFTVGTAAPEEMADRAAAAVAAGVTVLKVKLRGDRAVDERAMAAVREAAPEATVRVDANEAFTPRAAVRVAETAAEYGVEFLEQPVPAEDPEGLGFVYEHAPLPVAADESCLVASDVARVADRADVVVLKLMKTGGPVAARDAVAAARAHGLEVMLGCMVESAAAIAAAAHLAPLVEYADLDGSLLLADGEDPVDGVVEADGSIDLASVERGTGARR